MAQKINENGFCFMEIHFNIEKRFFGSVKLPFCILGNSGFRNFRTLQANFIKYTNTFDYILIMKICTKLVIYIKICRKFIICVERAPQHRDYSVLHEQEH